MKKLIFLLVLIFINASISEGVGGRSSYTPEVRYICPEDSSVLFLEENKDIIFQWKPIPIPAGGRLTYRFELFKGFEYDRVMDKTLPANVFKIEVPSEEFEPDAIYTWQVKQRDEVTHNWSDYTRWSFKVERSREEKVKKFQKIQKDIDKIHTEKFDERLEKRMH